MARPTPTRDAILALLRDREEEEGAPVPLTAADIADILEMHRKTVDGSIRCCRSPNKPKLLYIARWQRAEAQGKWAPMYAVGDREDAKPPRRQSHKIRNRAYRERNRAAVRASDRARNKSSVNPLFDALNPKDIEREQARSRMLKGPGRPSPAAPADSAVKKRRGNPETPFELWLKTPGPRSAW